MADSRMSVLDHETKLAFRRRVGDGWVPGLPKRKRKSEYSDYTEEDAETLSALHSGMDAIKALFNRRDNKSFILTSMSVQKPADDLVKHFGPLLWPGKQGRIPAFIDPDSGLDFSIEEHKERCAVWTGACECRLTFHSIRQSFFCLVMAKAFRYTENQSRYVYILL